MHQPAITVLGSRFEVMLDQPEALPVCLFHSRWRRDCVEFIASLPAADEPICRIVMRRDEDFDAVQALADLVRA